MAKCKFCGEFCEPKEVDGQEVDVCGPCFRQFKRLFGMSDDD